MKHLLRLSAVLLSVFLLSACGGSPGSDENTTSPDNDDAAGPVAIYIPKKTGQIKSYDESGNVVTDGSIKDDGYYRKGVAPNYTRDDTKEIVTDHVVGLQWQDNADISNAVNKNWANAKTYCDNLVLGEHSDWRLPTIDELMYIADRSRSYPAIDPTFQNTRSGFYWSSTSVVGDEYYAWLVDFDDGFDSWYVKSYSNYVRCVRAGE